MTDDQRQHLFEGRRAGTAQKFVDDHLGRTDHSPEVPETLQGQLMVAHVTRRDPIGNNPGCFPKARIPTAVWYIQICDSTPQRMTVVTDSGKDA